MGGFKNLKAYKGGKIMTEERRRRVALVTGGARGIGKSIVLEFAKNGYSVAFCYNKSSIQAQELIDCLLDMQVNCLAVKCDVSDSEQVNRMAKELRNCFGFVDTVVNNAGISHINMFTQETAKDFDDVIGVNLKGAFNVCRALVPDMVSEKFGSIINISSVWGVKGAACEVLYSVSKAGLIGLTKSLSLELAPSNITVNALAPGMIDTQMNSEYSVAEVQEFLQSVQLKRMGTANEVAAAVVFLANNSYITGEVININGGM